MNKSDLPLIVLDVGSEQIEFYLMHSVCNNPKCDCNGVSVKLVNDAQDITFFIDFETGTYRDDDYNKEEREVIEAFVVFMNSCENKSYNLDFFQEKV